MTTTDLQSIPQIEQAIVDDAIATDTVTFRDSKHSLEEMITLRYKHNMSINQIADKMGCHKSTVFRKLEKYLKILPNPEEVESYRENKTIFLESLELKVYKEMMQPDKLKDASFNNLAYGFQNISTQNRLEKGLVTSRIESFSVTASLDDLDRRKQELLKTVRCTTVQDVVPTTDNVTS